MFLLLPLKPFELMPVRGLLGFPQKEFSYRKREYMRLKGEIA